MNQALQTLKAGVDSLSAWLQPDGELFDPIFFEPTQYGTPYYALCNAVLARELGAEGEVYRERALRGLRASLAYVLHPELPPRLSSVRRETGEAGGSNHRDFFWPAILKTYRLLKALDPDDLDGVEESIAAVRVEESFAQRPPSNWAAVWLSGEWMRYYEGFSPYTRDQIDTWLGAYFANHVRVELGLYLEPGFPNSYDLFTRYHLADILLNGYDGPWRNELEALFESGLRRSLAVQLSDGSLASAHRSTGQTWTLGVQCAFFRMAAGFFEDRDPQLAVQAAQAAGRALSAMRRFQRPSAPFSPVENILPPNYRVGYEAYTADGHYSSLALGFLATAVLRGLENIEAADLAPREPAVFIEHDPTFRAVAHNGPYSLHFTAAPAAHYDAFGIVDVSFGPGRYLQLVSSARATNTEHFYNLGIAHREQPGRSRLDIVGQAGHDLIEPIAAGPGPASLRVRTRPKGVQFVYEMTAQVEADGVHINERLVGSHGYKTLLIPYLRNAGTGATTQGTFESEAVRLALGAEEIRIAFDQPVEHIIDLPYGYENRRGLCGLLRVDFLEPTDGVGYHLFLLR